ncbi:ATP-dependent Clp protease proteolytic subunit [Vibrio viridaestus]|uniref:Peptidase S14 n=1 Tax=Vibrio viridaestus TaxID=2487322 RepID=A0A3N9TL23_9VIBR|nr:ATP-dependent Clp protease proteolytic subunit [Vibrio viridaestus]RQW64977.1 hypothetical protein EES38_02770 [Vibrio viridaestus]
MKYILLIFMFLPYSSFAMKSLNPIENPNVEKIYIQQNLLYLTGDISDQSVGKVMTMIEASKQKVRTIVVNSLGGDLKAGIKLGSWIYNNNISLIVNGFCASSCANYLFTAAKTVHITHNSVVMWHGGATQESLLADPTNKDEVKWYFDLIKLETEFFQRIGVQQLITTYGQLNNFVKLDNTPACVEGNKKGQIQGWTYTLNDLKVFGVNRVTFDDATPAVGFRGKLMSCIVSLDER